jgi:Skp family chaperone for outer membrane proteins
VETTDLQTTLFERDLARRIQKRLETEIQRLQNHVAAIEADRNALRQRLDERERYLGALHASRGWRILQALRGLFGRRW